MKPHLIRDRGIWVCAIGLRRTRYGIVVFAPGIVVGQRYPLGHGYKPADAFNDWKAQQ